jgi:hypothetical protein
MAEKLFKNLNGEIVEMDAEETAHALKEAAEWDAGDKDRAMAALRRERDGLLADTDFYALSDVTLSDEMKIYRQRLRDLPANSPNPYNVTWPTRPS